MARYGTSVVGLYWIHGLPRRLEVPINDVTNDDFALMAQGVACSLDGRIIVGSTQGNTATESEWKPMQWVNGNQVPLAYVEGMYYGDPSYIYPGMSCVDCNADASVIIGGTYVAGGVNYSPAVLKNICMWTNGGSTVQKLSPLSGYAFAYIANGKCITDDGTIVFGTCDDGSGHLMMTAWINGTPTPLAADKDVKCCSRNGTVVLSHYSDRSYFTNTGSERFLNNPDGGTFQDVSADGTRITSDYGYWTDVQTIHGSAYGVYHIRIIPPNYAIKTYWYLSSGKTNEQRVYCSYTNATACSVYDTTAAPPDWPHVPPWYPAKWVDTTMTILPSINAPVVSSSGSGTAVWNISGDGSTVIGQGPSEPNDTHASSICYWDRNNKQHFLTKSRNEANFQLGGISYDGSVIFGVAVIDTNFSYDSLTPMFDLTEDDFMSNASNSPSSANSIGPVVVQIKNIGDQDNDIQLEFSDRNIAYASAIAEAVDQAQIDTDRRRYSSNQSAHMFADITAANVSAQLLLQKEWILNTYYFDLDSRFLVLDPMDLVTITESYLNLNRQLVRITEMTENSDGTLSFVAEEVVSGGGKVSEYSWNSSEGTTQDYSATAGSINTPIMFIAPTELTSGSLEIWIGVSSSNSNVWGGCTVSLSSDNETYSVIGSIGTSSRTGVTTSSFPAV